MNKLTIIMAIFTLMNLYGQSINKNNKKSFEETYLNKTNSMYSAHLKDSIVSNKSIEVFEKINILERQAIKACQEGDFESVYSFLLGKIEVGENDILMLEDTIGIKLRWYKRHLYDSLETKVNKNFIEYCFRYYPNINMELTFMYRNLLRYDQRYLNTASLHSVKSNNEKMFRIRDSINHQNDFTKIVLEKIFKEDGIPGINQVGPLCNSVEVFFLHIDPSFVREHLSNLQQKIRNNQVFISDEGFKFLIDKTLYRCCNYTIYGTTWSKYAPLKNESEIQQIKLELEIE